MDIKNRLERDVWSSEMYFQMAKKGSMDIDHPGMKILQKLSQDSGSILDLGCGEGTRLNLLLNDKRKGVGIDNSQKALDMGEKSYPKIRFIKANLERIPLKSNSFDLVYTAYVLEHLINPERVLEEAIRLTSLKGNLVLIAPNYGAPNRASPPFNGSRIKKFIEGLMNDLINLITTRDLKWRRVEPIANKTNYDVDWDTTIEPYLGDLINYFRSLGLKIKQYTSCWSEELPDAKIHQKVFRMLGELGIYPFNLWGPHLVLAIRKS